MTFQVAKFSVPLQLSSGNCLAEILRLAMVHVGAVPGI